jgi:cysteine-rich repeat protein
VNALIRSSVVPALAFAALVGCGRAPEPAPAVPSPAPSAALPTAVCGDAIVTGAEECDDANANQEDGCLSNCYRPANWVSGDPHTHGSGCFAERTPDELQYALSGRNLQVASALVWGDGYSNDRAYFTGEDDPISKPGRILHYDLEVSRFPAANLGHLVMLGLRSIDFSPTPFETPRSGVPIVEWGRAQGSLIGMAHGHFWPSDGRFPNLETCCVPLEFPVHVARGRISFLETERTGTGPVLDPGTFLLWKVLLNTGYQVSLAGASDFPCLPHKDNDDTPRTDVIVDGALSYAGWLDGIRRGRSTVVTGRNTHLNLRVNGARLGSEVRVAAGDTVTATLETRFGEPTTIEVLVNGEVVARPRVEADTQVVSVPLRASSSFWVAARTPRAATSPIYVLAGGRPIRASATDACYLVRYMGHLVDLANSGRLPLGESTAEAFSAYAEARAEFSKRFFEAGGQSCL